MDRVLLTSDFQGYRACAYRYDTGEKLWEDWQPDKSRFYSISRSIDNKFIAIGTRGLAIRDASTFSLLHHIGVVPTREVRFSMDGNYLASGDRKCCVKLYKVPSFELVATGSGHQQEVRPIAFSPSSDRVASGCEAGQIMIWSVPALDKLHAIQGDAEGVWALIFLSEDALVSGGQCHTLRVWNAATGEPITNRDGLCKDEVVSLALSPDGQHLAVGSYDQHVRIFSTDEAQFSLESAFPVPGVIHVLCYADWDTILVGIEGSNLIAIDAATGKVTKTFEEHNIPSGIAVLHDPGLFEMPCQRLP